MSPFVAAITAFLAKIFTGEGIKILSGNKFDFSRNINIQLSSDLNLPKVTYNAKTQASTINLAKLSEEEINDLKKLFREAEKGTQLLREDVKTLAPIVESTLDRNENKAIIEYFNGKIPSEDLEILKAAVVIKARFFAQQTNEVSRLKQQLRTKYGEKANNITNLHTANYFEDFLKPLYEEMESSESENNFLPTYNKLIADFPIAIFVNKQMTKEQLRAEIVLRVEKSRKYGIRTLNVHGIGRVNIKVIKDALKELQVQEFTYSEDFPTPDSIVVHINTKNN